MRPRVYGGALMFPEAYSVAGCTVQLVSGILQERIPTRGSYC